MKVHRLENGLFYTDSEILELYTSVADKKKQIKILAELNACTKDDIHNALLRAYKKYGYRETLKYKKHEITSEITSLSNKLAKLKDELKDVDNQIEFFNTISHK